MVLIAAPIAVVLALTSKTGGHPPGPTGPPGTSAGIASPSPSSGPATVAATIPVGSSPEILAVGEGAVWVTNSGDDTVTRIDRTNRATDSITVGSGPAGVVVDTGIVAVVNSGHDTVMIVDPADDWSFARSPWGATRRPSRSGSTAPGWRTTRGPSRGLDEVRTR